MAHNLLPEAPKVFYLYSRLISIYLYVINNILGTYNFIAWIEETFAMNRMIFLYNINRLVILTVIFALPGCTFMKLMTSRIEKPTFTYTGFEVVEASQSATRVNFLFSVHNPNEAGLKNVTCSYELFVEGKQILKGKDIPLALQPKGDTEIKIPATIAYTDLFPVVRSVVRRILSGQKTIPVTIEAIFSGKPAIYIEAGKEKPISFEMKFVRTADIPLPQVEKT
jgi:LEA14-like dessication related protein